MRTKRYLSDFVWGVMFSLLVTSLLSYGLHTACLISIDLSQFPSLQQGVAWGYQNLGLSILPFGLTLGLYCVTLIRLKQLLQDKGASSLSQVTQLDHLLDIWVGLFFGIGVIWTAIGMRGALLSAFSDTGQIANDGALMILSRLVDGGILIALSTTIFGGIGGYLLKVVKSLWLGAALRQFYCQQGFKTDKQILQQLLTISQQLETVSDTAANKLQGTKA